MHGDPPARIRAKIADMSERRDLNRLGPMTFGVAAYAVDRDTEKEAQRELARITNVSQTAAGNANYHQWLAGTKLEQQVSLEATQFPITRIYVSGLVGTPATGSRSYRRVRSRRRRSVIAAVQSSAGRDGTVRREHNPNEKT